MIPDSDVELFLKLKKNMCKFVYHRHRISLSSLNSSILQKNSFWSSESFREQISGTVQLGMAERSKQLAASTKIQLC